VDCTVRVADDNPANATRLACSGQETTTLVAGLVMLCPCLDVGGELAHMWSLPKSLAIPGMIA